MTAREIKIDTFAGVNEGDDKPDLSLVIRFSPGYNCGPNPDYNPGVGMSIESNYVLDVSKPVGQQMLMGAFWSCGFVMSRTDASRLRDELEIFLKETA